MDSTVDNQTELTNQQLEAQYPGIEYAYPIAVSSYELALKRLDAIDGRLQTMLAFIVAVSAIVPAVAVPRGIHFRANMFYMALGIFAFTLAFGIFARIFGRIYVVTPKKLHDHWLYKPRWTFQFHYIVRAADDFRRNNRLIKFKWWSMVVISLLFCAQAVCLAAWVMAGF